jgi:hypothetical protein
MADATGEQTDVIGVIHRLAWRADVALAPSVRREHQGHRTVRLERHSHRRAEVALAHLKTLPAQHTAERVEQPTADVGRGGRGEIGAAAVTRIAVQRELGNHEHRPADVADRALQAPAVVIEYPQPGDLGGEALPVFRAIVRAYAEEDHHAVRDLGDALLGDADRGRSHALNDRADGLLQHPGVVAAHDRFDLGAGQVPGREDSHALGQRQPGDIGDFPEPVTVLEKKLLAIDLDQLTAIG